MTHLIKNFKYFCILVLVVYICDTSYFFFHQEWTMEMSRPEILREHWGKLLSLIISYLMVWGLLYGE